MPSSTDRFAVARGSRLCLVVIVAVCGSAICVGCSSESGRQSASGSAATPPPPLSARRVISLPGPSPRGELFVKPGHWSSVWLEATANEADFRGRLDGQWVDAAGAPLGYPPIQFRLRHDRPLILPKGQQRGVEQLMFAPNDDDDVAGPMSPDRRESRLREASGRFRLTDEDAWRSPLEVRQRLTALRDHQALFVVLAAKPAAAAFLGNFDALATLHSPSLLADQDVPYRVVYAAESNRALLPSSLLGWTTTAYVLWDGYDLANLDEARRLALVDWLHWGGVLIVGGPGTLDGPACETLRPWLPASADGVVELDAAALEPLAELTLDRTPPATSRSWTGVRLRPTAEARVVVGTDAVPLVVERRVGRGRIVATAFRPAQRELVDWPSYAGFFSTHLMRRPPRLWRTHPMDPTFVAAVWNDRNQLFYDDQLRHGSIDPWYDPARTGGVRLLTHGGSQSGAQLSSFDAQPPVGPGIAAWRDDDELTAAARRALLEASGIFVPSASVVFGLIALYVFTVVPANWTVFYTLGRTEWAWAATPVLAFVFTIVVVRAAGLDLGFVRSATDVTVVELQPDYDRGQVTRYVALYNSLGTDYEIGGGDATFAALPLPATVDKKQKPVYRTYELIRRDGEDGAPATSLVGFGVDSGSIGLVRTEQTMPLGGMLRAEQLAERRYRISNGTPWELRDVRLSGLGNGAAHVIPPGGSVIVTLNDDEPPEGDAAGRRATIDVEPIWSRLQPADSGDLLRLTAWSSTATPGLVVDPPPSQSRQKTIIVAHLRYAADPPPASDVNTRAAVEKSIVKQP